VSGQELVCDRAAAVALAPEWEALALAASKPAAGASWVLAWWRHVAPADTEARVVVLRDAGRMVGIAPFHLVSDRRGVAEYRLMSSDFGVSIEPLALPGRERDLAAAIGRALAGTSPRASLLGFGPMPISSPWIAALEDCWQGPARPIARRMRAEGAPVVQLREPGYEQWFATLGSKLRHDLRRCERRFEEAGGSTRWSDAASLRADAESFARLHSARWEGRGWSRLADLGPRMADWLEDLAAPLLAQGRLGLCVLEVEGRPICVDLHLSAGEEAVGVNVGWDEQYARLAPASLAVLRVVAGAYEKGCRRLRLGNGRLANKVRLSNTDDPVAWTALVPPSSRAPLAYGTLLPGLLRMHGRELLVHALGERWLERLKATAAGRRG
jgi:CelD/BcsL family acetyltransferase involved in cellulose biosynthesis